MVERAGEMLPAFLPHISAAADDFIASPNSPSFQMISQLFNTIRVDLVSNVTESHDFFLFNSMQNVLAKYVS